MLEACQDQVFLARFSALSLRKSVLGLMPNSFAAFWWFPPFRRNASVTSSFSMASSVTALPLSLIHIS